MNVPTVTKYTVDGLPGGSQQFDTTDEAEAVIRAFLSGPLPEPQFEDDVWHGEIGVRWYAEEVPASIFDTLVVKYLENPHGLFNQDDAYAEWGLDSANRYLLVEENVRGGYWLSSDDAIEPLMDNHFNQEYASEWEFVAMFDTTTGDEVDITVRTSYEVQA